MAWEQRTMVKIYRGAAATDEVAQYAGEFVPSVGDSIITGTPEKRYRVTRRGVRVSSGEPEVFVVVDDEPAAADVFIAEGPRRFGRG